MRSANVWWGYLHENGSLHVKRYFSTDDLIEAGNLPFIHIIAGPWEANSREEALEKLEADLTDL